VSTAEGTQAWALLPFRFRRLVDQRVVVTNEVGEHVLLDPGAFQRLASLNLDADDQFTQHLRGKHLVRAVGDGLPLELLAMKRASQLRTLAGGPALHIFVVTLRCEHSCPYCQVSRQTSRRDEFDMPEDIAVRAIDIALATPSRQVKIEFQGGEPLLHFDMVKEIVNRASAHPLAAEKDLQFVIATNLALLSDEVISFARAHDIYFSTSLDGPRDVHNTNRPRRGQNSWELATAGIRRIQDELGPDRVSALMTTTEATLGRVEEVIDMYVELGLRSIFLRPLSPYGFAVKHGGHGRYDAERWLAFYERGLDHILELNLAGVQVAEQYAAIVLRKMLSNEDAAYVDLMSPAGMALRTLVYNYDGSVYASDEGRMLAEMGDQTFRLGDVRDNDLSSLVLNDVVLDALDQSFTKSVPGCVDCAYESWCGADPVFHHTTSGSFVGRKPTSAFCQRNLGVFDLLVRRYEDDPAARRVFRRWARR
jgi:uncharacterized protein